MLKAVTSSYRCSLRVNFGRNRLERTLSFNFAAMGMPEAKHGRGACALVVSGINKQKWRRVLHAGLLLRILSVYSVIFRDTGF